MTIAIYTAIYTEARHLATNQDWREIPRDLMAKHRELGWEVRELADMRELDDEAHATQPVVLTDDQIQQLWAKSWDISIKESGAIVGNAEVAYMNQPLVFYRAILEAHRIKAAPAAESEVVRCKLELGCRCLSESGCASESCMYYAARPASMPDA